LKTLYIPFQPRPFQLEIRKNLKKLNLVICHRQAGKTYGFLALLVELCLTKKDLVTGEKIYGNPKYAFFSPTEKQTNNNVSDSLSYLTQFIPDMKWNRQNSYVEFPNGSKIYLLGSKSSSSAEGLGATVRGLSLHGFIADEIAYMPPSFIFSVLQPMLLNTDGWGILSGTPQGHNHLYDIYNLYRKDPDAYVDVFDVYRAGVLSGKKIEFFKRTTPKHIWEQEYLCSFDSQIRGAYYNDLLFDLGKKGHFGNVPYIRSSPVITAWDIGLSDDVVIWFVQMDGDAIRIIDYYENREQQPDFYMKILIEKNYIYKKHLIPHDSNRRTFGLGKTFQDYLQDFGFPYIKVPRLTPYEGITAVRSILPRCFFNTENTDVTIGLDHLMMYRVYHDETTGINEARIKKSKHNHAADAFRYLAVGLSKSEGILQTTYQKQWEEVGLTRLDPFDNFNI